MEVNSWRDFVSYKVVSCCLLLDRKVSRYLDDDVLSPGNAAVLLWRGHFSYPSA